jgi:HK97 family phage prohead protease
MSLADSIREKPARILADSDWQILHDLYPEIWQEKIAQLDPNYERDCRAREFRARTGREPRKNWDPFEIPHYRRANLFKTRSRQPDTMYGYALIWDSPLSDRRDVYEAGCCANFLEAGVDFGICLDHDWRRILTRKSEGAVFCAEDCEGLYFEVKLGTNPHCEHLRHLAERGAIFGVSTHNLPEENVWTGEYHLIRETKIIEISILPNAPGASGCARAYYQP